MSSEAIRWWRASLESYEDTPSASGAMGEDIESIYCDGLVIDVETGLPTTRDPHAIPSPNWAKKNRPPGRVASQNVRAAGKRLRADLTPEQWEAILQAFGFTCAYCGLAQGALVIEHVVPIARGGGTTKENIVPACAYCNGSKGTKTIEEWCWQFGKSPAPILDRIARGRAVLERIEQCVAFE